MLWGGGAKDGRGQSKRVVLVAAGSRVINVHLIVVGSWLVQLQPLGFVVWFVFVFFVLVEGGQVRRVVLFCFCWSPANGVVTFVVAEGIHGCCHSIHWIVLWGVHHINFLGCFGEREISIRMLVFLFTPNDPRYTWCLLSVFWRKGGFAVVNGNHHGGVVCDWNLYGDPC